MNFTKQEIKDFEERQKKEETLELMREREEMARETLSPEELVIVDKLRMLASAYLENKTKNLKEVEKKLAEQGMVTKRLLEDRQLNKEEYQKAHKIEGEDKMLSAEEMIAIKKENYAKNAAGADAKWKLPAW